MSLTVAARSISTSYRDVVSADMLKGMLQSGQAPEQFQPHLITWESLFAKAQLVISEVAKHGRADPFWTLEAVRY